MHQIGPTDRVTLEDRTFEVELKPHHQGGTYEECEKDCPKDWQIAIYRLLQDIRNSPDRDKFGLLHTLEFVQNPDKVSRERGYVARFYAGSGWAYLG